MKRVICSTALLLTAVALYAAEHPKEHPTSLSASATANEQTTGKEHPAGHEHPVGSKAWNKQMRAEFNEAVEAHVADNSKEGGFRIHDHKLNKQWALKLIGVHKNRIVNLGGNSFFACADFKTIGKGKKDKVDLDFYATKTATGWQIDKVLIHKVNGKPRYTYNEKNEMVPAADAGGLQPEAEKPGMPNMMKNMGSQ